jgi:glyoxylase I family protein
VKDLEACRKFYAQVIGLTEKERPDLGFEGAWFALGAHQELHLLCLDKPCEAAQLPEHPGRDAHFAIAVESLPLMMTRLNGYKVPFTQSRSGRQAIFTRDPDGNGLELVKA